VSWLTLSIDADARDVDAVSAAMEALGALAVTTRPEDGHALLEPAPGEQPLAPRNRVTGLFERACDGARLSARLSAAVAGRCPSAPSVAVLENADWEQAWRQRAEARAFGGGLWVLPGDEVAPASARAVVRLEPGLAFGTGAHPSTALCLQWLAGLPLVGRRVIDFGCGSGILAIAAAVLGAEEVWAWDHDPQALDATRRNAERNGVAARIRLAPRPPPAEVLVANILANALDALAPRFAALVRPGGALGLSGILPPQAPVLASRYADAFRVDAPRERDGWVLLTATRLPAARGETPCT
jgi:ribosomal protein L11 methyltransferase